MVSGDMKDGLDYDCRVIVMMVKDSSIQCPQCGV